MSRKGSVFEADVFAVDAITGTIAEYVLTFSGTHNKWQQTLDALAGTGSLPNEIDQSATLLIACPAVSAQKHETLRSKINARTPPTSAGVSAVTNMK